MTNKLIITLVFLCILLSVFTQGLTSSALDLVAFTLLISYLFSVKKSNLRT
ncbi:MAG: hypothetical protein ACI935_000471 [Moritella dasanensis]|jgi:hypothetical protein